MGRRSDFTPAEDRIILRFTGQSAKVTNAALQDAGYSWRSASAISQRRYYLRRSRMDDRSMAETEIGKLDARRVSVQSQLADLDKRRDILIAELEEIRSALAEKVSAVTALDDAEKAS